MTEKLLPKLKESSTKARVIVVSSGGMLTNKMDTTDLNFEKMNPFDGTMAYAQNKRQQVIMTEQLALAHPDVYFASMHPGKYINIIDFPPTWGNWGLTKILTPFFLVSLCDKNQRITNISGRINQ